MIVPTTRPSASATSRASSLVARRRSRLVGSSLTLGTEPASRHTASTSTISSRRPGRTTAAPVGSPAPGGTPDPSAAPAGSPAPGGTPSPPRVLVRSLGPEEDDGDVVGAAGVVGGVDQGGAGGVAVGVGG